MNNREFERFERERPEYKQEIAGWAITHPHGTAPQCIDDLEFPFAGDKDMLNHVGFYLNRARHAAADGARDGERM